MYSKGDERWTYLEAVGRSVVECFVPFDTCISGPRLIMKQVSYVLGRPRLEEISSALGTHFSSQHDHAAIASSPLLE